MGCASALGYGIHTQGDSVEDCASALGYGIHTQGDSVEEVRRNVREAVDCTVPASLLRVLRRNHAATWD